MREKQGSRRHIRLHPERCYPLPSQFEYTLRCEICPAPRWVTLSYSCVACAIGPQCVQIWRRPVNRKYITYRNAARRGQSHCQVTCTKNWRSLDMWFWKYVDINIYVPLTFSYHMSAAEHVPDQLYQINHESTGVKSPYSCAQRRLYTITTRLFCALMSTIISSAYSVDCRPTQASEGQCHVILMENTINKSQADLGNSGGGFYAPSTTKDRAVLQRIIKPLFTISVAQTLWWFHIHLAAGKRPDMHQLRNCCIFHTRVWRSYGRGRKERQKKSVNEWPGGVVVRALDLRLQRSRVRPFRFRVTTLGRLLAHMCLCHQAV